MARNEKKFLKDVENALKPWSNERESFHEDGGFIVRVFLKDAIEWAEKNDLIWKALDKVSKDWGADLDDSGIQEFTISIPED